MHSDKMRPSTSGIRAISATQQTENETETQAAGVTFSKLHKKGRGKHNGINFFFFLTCPMN